MPVAIPPSTPSRYPAALARLRRALSALALLPVLLVPGLAAAQGCEHDEARLSCAQGTQWDEASQSCITVSS
ncbi:hypothetical protein [Frigidibacter oleivorans]|uniref:hypothetical protein n=1 Tax=Frigidibacter oleivorans TaxID=2487129 RepID=UPI000F8CE8C1|nr:hypothetical protein [Frigidibacter oleivorans]